jgi:hypothetical protein
MKRIVIYPKDVMLITGKSERSSRMLLSEIKNYLNKNSKQFVTVKEFATYTGIDLADVLENLQK